MKVVVRSVAALAVLIAVAGAAFVTFAWRAEIAAVEPPAPDSFAPERVARGAGLAALGNCNVCHTAEGGEPFAGGRALRTDFGTIYATNITPDPETGIGRWTEAAFIRSMREGVDRAGNHLYPAFPYDHFTLVSNEDNRALYAYLMTRPPVRSDVPANDLPFPFDQRLLLAGWNLLFLDPRPYRPDPNLDATLNRGRYLAEGLGHCGACHTPRNAFGAEQPDRHFAGSEAEGWTAYALDESNPAAVPWTVEAMTHYLRTGWHAEHGVSRGSMAPVTANMAAVPEADVAAIAAYVVAGMGPRDAAEPAAPAAAGAPTAAPSGDSMAAAPEPAAGGDGAAIYAAACGICHDAGRPLPHGALNLALSTGVTGPNPQNLVNVVLYGLPAAEGEASPVMPGFAGTLSEEQLAGLIDFVRERFTDRPAWTDTRERVRATLSGATAVSHYRSHGLAGDAPANLGEVEVTW